MRVFGTIVFGFLFLVVFFAFFVFQSITGLPTSTEEVVDILRKAEVRKAAVDAVEQTLRTRVRQSPNPEFAEAVLGQARATLDQHFTDEWFYGMVEKSHRGFVELLETGKDTTLIDMADNKAKLRALLLQLGDKVSEAEAGGAEVEHYRGQVLRTIDTIPDEVNFTWLLARGEVDPVAAADTEEIRKLREAYGQIETARRIGLAVLAVLLVLIALINKRSLQRMLINVGLVLALSSLVYLVTVDAIGELARDEIESQMQAEYDRARAAGRSGLGVQAGRRVALALLDQVYQRESGPVTLILFVGLAGVGGGIALHFIRRKGTGKGAPPPAARAYG